jgi:hypothetical protein
MNDAVIDIEQWQDQQALEQTGAEVASARDRGRVCSPSHRYDIYAIVHKGLRAFMCDTLTLLGRMDADDASDLAAGLAALRALLEVCSIHLGHENRHVHAAMEARRPGSSARTSEDHLEHEEAIEALESLAEAVECSTGAERRAVATRLYREVALFVAENLVHMDVEESHNTAVLWDTYTDEELIAIEHAIVSSIPPADQVRFQRWMLPSVTPAERAGMLIGMRQAAPAHAFEATLGAARPHLNAKEWGKLQAALEVS